MSDVLATRYPTVHFTDADVFPADVDGCHPCPDLDGDTTETTVAIRYQRHGWTHIHPACGLCEITELAMLHHGNPQPAFVRVTRLTEPATAEAPADLRSAA